VGDAPGEGWWEFLERAGNYGVPLAFLYWSQPGSRLQDWFAAIRPQPLMPMQARRLAWILRITTAALLIGHGGFGAFMQKAAWIEYFGAAGITPQMAQGASLIALVGWFEIALGLLVLAKPVPAVLIFVFVWKVGTELLRLLVGEPFWEFIERGGSYAAPLALLYVRSWSTSTSTKSARPPQPSSGGPARDGSPGSEARARPSGPSSYRPMLAARWPTTWRRNGRATPARRRRRSS
jgi:hypothetical protein